MNDENISSILGSISEIMATDEQRDKIAKNLIFVNRAKNAPDSISQTYLRFGNEQKTIPVTLIKTDDFKKIYLALHGKQRKISAQLLRIFKEQFYEIVTSDSPEKKLFCSTDVTQIINGESNIEFVAGFGVAKKEYSEIGLKGVSTKIILSDALYDDIPFDRALVLSKSLEEGLCKHSTYIPIRKYIKADPTFRTDKNSHKRFIEIFQLDANKIASKVSSAYKKSYKSKGISNISITELIKSIDIPNNAKMDYLCLFIIDNQNDKNISILESYLKENFDVEWNNTHYKRLLCIYDFLKN